METQQIRTVELLFRLDVAVRNVKVFGVAIGMQQSVPSH